MPGQCYILQNICIQTMALYRFKFVVWAFYDLERNPGVQNLTYGVYWKWWLIDFRQGLATRQLRVHVQYAFCPAFLANPTKTTRYRLEMQLQGLLSVTIKYYGNAYYWQITFNLSENSVF